MVRIRYSRAGEDHIGIRELLHNKDCTAATGSQRGPYRSYKKTTELEPLTFVSLQKGHTTM